MTPQMINLRKLVAVRVPEERTARRIARDSGLAEERLIFDGTASDRWDAIFREALATNKLQNLFERLLEELEGDSAMAEAVAAARVEPGSTIHEDDGPNKGGHSWKRAWPVVGAAVAILIGVSIWAHFRETPDGPKTPTVVGTTSAPTEMVSAPPPLVVPSSAPIEENSSVRLIHYRLKGRAIDQFLRGTFRIGTAPPVIVIETDTVSTLRTALKSRGIKPDAFREGYARSEDDGNNHEAVSDDEDKELRSNSEFLEFGAGYDIYADFNEYSAAISEVRLREMAADNDWRVRKSTDGSFMLWRYADRQNLKDLKLPLYYQLTESNVPKHFLVTMLFGQPGIEGCPGILRQLVLTAPARQLEFEVAVLENISDKPITLGDFGYWESRDTELRNAEANDDLAVGQAVRRVMYPPRQLRPNEQLGLLLQVTLRYPATQGRRVRDLLEAAPITTPGKYPLLEPQPELNESTFFPHNPFNVRKVEVKLAAVASDTDPDLSNTLVYGRTIRLDGVEVNHQFQTVRPAPGNKIAFIQANMPGASCPHIYTKDAASGAWIPKGPIIVGYVGKRREAEAAMQLSDFNGRILIREEDDEISFLDQVHVDVVSGDHPRRLWATEPLLRYRDNQRLMLRKGEEIELNFPVGPEDKVVSLVAYGYYEPTSPQR